MQVLRVGGYLAIVMVEPDPWTKYVAIGTGVLALATFVLALFTKRMANVAGKGLEHSQRSLDLSQKTLDLELRPYLAFNGLKYHGGAPGTAELRVVLALKNVGKVLLHYRLDLLEVNANDRISSDPPAIYAEDALAPTVYTEWRARPIKGIHVSQYFAGTVHFKATYWSADPNVTYVAEQTLEFKGKHVPNGEWWDFCNPTGTPNYT